jgi:hypothetical protein
VARLPDPADLFEPAGDLFDALGLPLASPDSRHDAVVPSIIGSRRLSPA